MAVKRPLSEADLTALVGVLGRLEGEIMIGQIDADVIRGIGERLRRDGLLIDPISQTAVRQALADLTQRIHYSLGAYDEPPVPVPVPEN